MARQTKRSDYDKVDVGRYRGVDDTSRNGTCPHPKEALKDIPGQPGRFTCGLCGVSGTVMARSEGGILTPKVWL